jgi:hypothetical protein
MTFARMVELIERQAGDREASHRVVAALKQAGTLADPLRALIRAAGLRTVARLVKKIASNDSVLAQMRHSESRVHSRVLRHFRGQRLLAPLMLMAPPMLTALRSGPAFVTGLRPAAELPPALVMELPPSVCVLPPTLVVAIGAGLPLGNLVFPGRALLLPPTLVLGLEPGPFAAFSQSFNF